MIGGVRKGDGAGLLITHWDVKVMKFDDTYINCSPLGDFLSIQGHICRGFKAAARLGRHVTFLHTVFTALQPDDGKISEVLAV